MSRYDRQMILPEIGAEGQARLAAADVLIVGAGGLGATVIPALAGAGVGRLRIVDGDCVDESNLHRQTLFRNADIGKPKADCAAREAMALNPEIAIEAIHGWLDPVTVGAMLEGADLVIDAADSFAVSYILSDACMSRRLPLIAASVLGRQGYMGGFCGTGPSLRALFPDLPQRAQNCATAGVMGPAVAVMGALQAQMAMSVLLRMEPSPIGQAVTVDLAGWRFGGFRFDDAPEPDGPALPFISRSDLRDADCVVELRPESEAPRAVTTGALRLLPEAMSAWQPPAGRRVVLCCRSGMRAWGAATELAGRGHRDLALLAAGIS
ncbi:HesA/MoeB/ThiF family protein [Paracoccus saliphilus]|uniref:HesA/MoeB/ThiF family protein n=1 Tax=Paracoccus saliphilus TaxID=405559 RepID=A0AA45W7P6_9RHOB|nr:HesA/MoeB/ThiF family protein [Paracoccus saliphilus]WCR02809.1 HesA/MoeB/ThiF family protein [Paracoccus saliphilus]SIT11617.1 Molybdopterin or thiamine biosynthesis adenylyltransferase [Paracoccus saliphilus]